VILLDEGLLHQLLQRHPLQQKTKRTTKVSVINMFESLNIVPRNSFSGDVLPLLPESLFRRS
jgi:hypothetical protein